MTTRLAIAFFLVACGGSSSPGTGDDDMPGVDAPVGQNPDAPESIPAMLTVSGATTQTGFSGTTPVAGVVVKAFSASDAMLAMGTTDANGKYTLTFPTSGAAWDGYIQATKSGFMDLYWYPPAALAADSSNGDMNMITPGNFNSLNNIAGGGQEQGKGVVGMAVLDAAGMGIEGAMVSSTPAAARYRYMESNGFPSSSATATAADGVAFMFSVPPGMVTITATKAGTTFRSHTINVRANAFTTTAIEP